MNAKPLYNYVTQWKWFWASNLRRDNRSPVLRLTLRVSLSKGALFSSSWFDKSTQTAAMTVKIQLFLILRQFCCHAFRLGWPALLYAEQAR